MSKEYFNRVKVLEQALKRLEDRVANLEAKMEKRGPGRPRKEDKAA